MKRLILPLFLLVAFATEALAEPQLRLEHLDLLPMNEFERQAFRDAHPELSKRLQTVASRIRGLEKKHAKQVAKDKKAAATLRAQIEGLQSALHADLTMAREALREHGLTDAMIELMDGAPTGASRTERYAHRLVLLLPDLDPAQRAIFERVVPEVDGAYLAAQAMHDRTKLALSQSGLEDRNTKAILSGFRRQTSVIESRFWRLVDYVLHDAQKAALWQMLPTRLRQHAGAQDHVFALADLAPAQGARFRALLTEVEAESAPDQALLRRLKAQSRDKTISREERGRIQKEMQGAYARLNDLKRYAYETTHDILTPAQIHALKAIPPRVSLNDRRRQGKQVLDGMTFTPEQEKAIALLRKEGNRAARAYRDRMKAIKKEAADVGADSPQQMMMQMMTMSAQGAALTEQRRLLGRVFREVMTPDQLSGWVMGLYGYRR